MSAVLDLFIGLAFMYFILSLIASFGQEIIAGVFAWRGTYLSKAIDVIIDNKRDASFTFVNWGDWFKAHFTPKAGRTVAEQYDIDVAAGTQAASPVLKQVLDIQKHPLLRSNPTTLPSYVSSKSFALAFLGVLRDGSSDPLFTQIKATIEKLPAGDLETTLALFAQDAAGDVDRFRASLEQWFDDAMDRVSGIYKRLTQYVMLILGFILAASLNVNTPHVVRVLWETPSLRASIVAEASLAAAADAQKPGGEAEVTKGLADFRDGVARFEKQSFPVGWTCWMDEGQGLAATGNGCDRTKGAQMDCATAWEFLDYCFGSLVGWIMTAVAVSLGAPFWFELVQKLVNIRSAGEKPSRAG